MNQGPTHRGLRLKDSVFRVKAPSLGATRSGGDYGFEYCACEFPGEVEEEAVGVEICGIPKNVGRDAPGTRAS